MIWFTTYVLPWILSGITIYMNVLAGNMQRNAWLVGLVGQVLWSIWILTMREWGFVPMNVALWIVYARNHLKWQAAKTS